MGASNAEIPAWFVVLPSACTTTEQGQAGVPKPAKGVREELEAAIARLAPTGHPFAVRSSAVGEDGQEHSFAGQLESVLGVAAADVPAAVSRVWASGATERVRAYRATKALEGPPPVPAVLVQRMVNPAAAGVAFGADPVTGNPDVAVISSVRGLANALVSGDVDGDTHRVHRDGTILQKTLAQKGHIETVAKAGGTRRLAVSAPEATQSAITDEEAVRIARLAWSVGRHLGRPQDIEWAIEGKTLWLLQARPITTLPQGPVALWDNSNIAESYAGVTTPLTYTFARQAYAAVYREMCRLLWIPQQAVDSESESFENLLGLVDGRMYYNLVSWYRILALLPGFSFNRRFMEQMMGVREELPADLLDQIRSHPRTTEGRWPKLKTALSLGLHQFMLRRKVRSFQARVDAALVSGPPAAGQDMASLAKEYRRLEAALLRRWDAPLINDFLAMIMFGALRQACQKWVGDADGTLQNALLCGGGGMVSAEPPRRIAEIAHAVRHDAALVATLKAAPAREAEKALRTDPRHRALYDAYLDRFGDRCLEELKLESPTLREDPTSLVRTIGEMAQRGQPPPAPDLKVLQAQAEARIRSAPGMSWTRRAALRWLTRNARARVRDRENLRFERTRVFGRVRQLFAEMGNRLHEQRVLEDPSDVFYLELEELLGAAEQGRLQGLGERAVRRRSEFARFRASAPPPDRFLTRGGRRQDLSQTIEPPIHGGEERAGLGCCPGVVRGRARVILDPRGAVVRAGEILVARRTDPGWILLFGAAQGLIVEHGSLLSHAAIVSREMGIPSVVGVAGVTAWLRDGDQVELDGQTGRVRRLPGASHE